MATCPKCGSHLTTGHRCRPARGQWVLELVLAAVIGAVTTMAMVAVFDRGHVLADFDGYFFVSGAALGMLIQYLLQRAD